MVHMGNAGRGPYFPSLRNEVADLIIGEGAIDVVNIKTIEDDDADDEVTFAATEDARDARAPPETEEEWHRRHDAIQAERAEKKERTFVLITELDRSTTLMSDHDRRTLLLWTESSIKMVIGMRGTVTTVDQKDSVTQTLTNKFETYITLDTLGAKDHVDWSKLKYIKSNDNAAFPLKNSMTKKTREVLGLKSCCFLPQCDLEDGKCSARDRVAREWKQSRPTPPDRPTPVWKQPQLDREEEAKRMRELAMTALAPRACKRWRRGMCHKGDACLDQHSGTPQCRSASAREWICTLDPCPYAGHTDNNGNGAAGAPAGP